MIEDRECVGRLSACYEGNQLLISRVEGVGVFKRRVPEMDFTPLEVQIKNTYVSLSGCETNMVIVTPVNETVSKTWVEE